jgi:hypothetical protein
MHAWRVSTLQEFVKRDVEFTCTGVASRILRVLSMRCLPGDSILRDRVAPGFSSACEESAMGTPTATSVDVSTLSATILSLLSSSKPRDELICDVVLAVQRATGFESVGLRLQDGLDFPYYFTRGFDQDFVEKEMLLCQRDSAGEILRDSNGDPYLECMCGNVIAGRTDPRLDFFTERGSFYSSCTTELLATTSDDDRQTRTRNRCNGEGYESVGLIPVRDGGSTFGLLQLNDRRKGMLPIELVQMMEGITPVIAMLFSMVQARERLAHQAADVTRLVSVRSMLLERIAVELEQAAPGEAKQAGSPVLAKLNEILADLEQLKGVLPVCSRCKRIRDDSGYWEQIEQYVRDRSKVEFTHTYCPECAQAFEKELARR